MAGGKGRKGRQEAGKSNLFGSLTPYPLSFERTFAVPNETKGEEVGAPRPADKGGERALTRGAQEKRQKERKRKKRKGRSTSRRKERERPKSNEGFNGGI
mmetsp:Transcript_44595/g.88131  ORF Transcript_44595/g.88131 Transcript_44595/m.88131 type:complete len:100 (+) Transcript_44595:701-1000(+)